MKSDNPVKHFVVAFLIALAVYLDAYTFIEHRRNRKGPWQVTFTTRSASGPTIMIDQPALHLTNVAISFDGNGVPGTNRSSTLIFDQPRPVPYDVPYGKCLFMDTTFLPGTLTLQLFWHEIQLLTLDLMIDHRSYPWQSNTNIKLQ